MTSRVRVIGMFVLLLGLVLAACDGSFGLPGRAADEWRRSYPLADAGELQITNTIGAVEIEGVTGSTVEVRAERIAHAATDAAARTLLSRLAIKEGVTPTRISIESERIGGLSSGAGYEVHYRVRVPKSAAVRVAATNGRIFLTALSGKTTAMTTNGGISATALAGGIRATTTNGQIDVKLTAVGQDEIGLRTTNGAVSLTLPVDSRADLDASVTNGTISVTGLSLEASDRSRRHLSARINGGGTPITVSTTNGTVRIGAP